MLQNSRTDQCHLHVGKLRSSTGLRVLETLRQGGLSPGTMGGGSRTYSCLPEKEWPLLMGSQRELTQKPKVGEVGHGEGMVGEGAVR